MSTNFLSTLIALSFLTVQLIGSGCKTKSLHTQNNYSNQTEYIVDVGDTVRIYYSFNSCCQYCISDNLSSIVLVDDREVDPGETDCDWCERVYAFFFQAIRPGTDTIFGKTVPASKSCEDSIPVEDKFFVEVR